MPFTARDIRYHAEETYPALYDYLWRYAQHYLGYLKHDPVAPESVINHVIDQLLRYGLFGQGDHTPPCFLDQMSPAQFYAFLHNCCRNKAIDELRKHRPPVSTFSDLESPNGSESDDDPLNEEIDPLWGVPFATPEEIMLALASQRDLRRLLIHCLIALKAAPKQMYAMIQELKDIGADEVLQNTIAALRQAYPEGQETPIAHLSQHKDHAHKKLRHCLQEQSSNLTVRVALRLTEYGIRAANSPEFTVAVHALAGDDLSMDDVRAGLRDLAGEGLIDWQGSDDVYLTGAQMKRLSRFYKED